MGKAGTYLSEQLTGLHYKGRLLAFAQKYSIRVKVDVNNKYTRSREY